MGQRFHCIYWPAFLMALNIKPPKQILVHAHWTLGKRKMSKSTGNVVNPFFALERFGVDGTRYYMVYDGGIQYDADYDNSFVSTRYKKGLSGGIGNLASRITRSKSWSVRKAVEQMATQVNFSPMDQPGREPSAKFEDLYKANEEHHSLLLELPSCVSQHFDNLDSSSALQAIMEVIFATNAYLQQRRPWNFERKAHAEKVDQIIFYCAESLRICGILLQPFMPAKMSQLLDTLGVSEDRRMLIDTKVGADQDYGTHLPGINLGRSMENLLFPAYTVDRIR